MNEYGQNFTRSHCLSLRKPLDLGCILDNWIGSCRMASTTTTMTSGIENPMNSTKTTTTTTGNHQNFNENLENRKKNSSKSFMQLNIETIPDSFQAKVSMKHQCYRLVPDTILSPIDDDDAENDVKDNNHHNSNNNNDDVII
ncbi:hypothetical protein DERF_011217 [Dermatophagoides farinae]|uniref:Uncharacterized protein n=1 Tax=Dermatophagoides farinae TaxID=6954 RepID=A0A922HUH7_DERFA|nr:hypothetical protein DERF_011217 [Dermatophagoides farinae]